MGHDSLSYDVNTSCTYSSGAAKAKDVTVRKERNPCSFYVISNLDSSLFPFKTSGKGSTETITYVIQKTLVM